MDVVVGVVMLAIACWCAIRMLVPEGRASGHGRALASWHLLMAGAMAAMLLASLPGPPVLGVGLFGLGAGWALISAGRLRRRGPHLRLAATSAAMVAMLAPALAPAPAGAAARDTTHDRHGGHDMAAMQETSKVTDAGHRALSSLPGPVLVVLMTALLAVLVVSAVRLLRRRTAPGARVDAACEALMAAAMGAMLLALL